MLWRFCIQFRRHRYDDRNICISWFRISWVTWATSPDSFCPQLTLVLRRGMKSPTQEGTTIFQLAGMSRSHQVMAHASPGFPWSIGNSAKHRFAESWVVKRSRHPVSCMWPVYAMKWLNSLHLAPQVLPYYSFTSFLQTTVHKCSYIPFHTCILRYAAHFITLTMIIFMAAPCIDKNKFFICPTNAHRLYWIIIKTFRITKVVPKYFGLHKPSSGSYSLCLAKNYISGSSAAGTGTGTRNVILDKHRL